MKSCLSSVLPLAVQSLTLHNSLQDFISGHPKSWLLSTSPEPLAAKPLNIQRHYNPSVQYPSTFNMASPLDGSNHDVAAGDTFPVKLYKLLHAAEQSGKTDIISWLGDGTKFKIHKKSEFASEIMPHFFSSSTYKSFQRSKNLW